MSQVKCPNCSTDNPSGAKFCKKCGKPLVLVCPACQTANSADAEFCTNCGSRLNAAPSPKITPSPSAAPISGSPPEALRPAPLNLEGERKLATILFTDIVGSMTLAEKLDPEQWKEIVNGAHWRVSEAVYRYGGRIAQLLGDGVLAFFGAPATHEDDPVRAVRAALEIQQAIADYGRSLAGYVDNFQMRIGINTGLVILGNVGTDQHLEYLAVGDAVNLAARLQSAAQPGKVLLSEATARFARALFNLEDLGEITVKGKSEPVRVLQVVGLKASPERERGIEGLVSPLVGRSRELESLRTVLSDLAQGHGHIVSIIGEPGIGKSRLAEELRSGHWLEGRSLSYGQALAFWTIGQLVRADLGVSDGDPEPKVRAALRKRVQELFHNYESDILPYLAHLLGLKHQGEEAERIQMLDGETLKRQVLLAISRYFEQVANAAPTVLVFEDLHWADPSTLEALEQLLAVTDRAPLLLMLLFRPERDLPSWRIKLRVETDFAHRYTEITLAPLSATDSNLLINALLDIADLPQTTRSMIQSRSEGNPFYLEEIVRHLIDEKAIVRDDGHWRATRDITNIEIPDTLQGVLLARLDRLDEDVRRTLQLASVIGRTFLYRLLQATAEAEHALDQHLSQLQRADLVREKARRPELEYIFKHSLTQEAAYNSLLLERRREFHRRVGQALEQLFGDHKEEYYGLLAYHFDRAGEREKAVEYLLCAGDRTRLEDAHTEAIQYYHRAIELLTDMGDTQRAAKTWLKLALVHHTNFDFDAAHQANEAAFALERKALRKFRREPPTDLAKGIVAHRVSSDVEFAPWSFDPGLVGNIGEASFSLALFAGIAEIDEELNVVPHAARSWEVLDGGTRYVIHLRDDVRWTDGTPVTAKDFEWAWKRNLDPKIHALLANLLDDIVGARDYREGRNLNPDSVGARALDPMTLEVQLSKPVAYFPYIFAEAITLPLPRETVERFGAEWWKPEHIVSNGAFRLVEFSERKLVLDRNPGYFGEFEGNIDRYQLDYHEESERLDLYLRNELDSAFFDLATTVRHGRVPAEELFGAIGLETQCIVYFNHPPLDDVRVRRALTLAVDHRLLAERMGYPTSAAARGGVIPPGSAGHSPEIGLPFDVGEARRALADAGYPGGVDFPVLNLGVGSGNKDEIVRQWHEHLGITVNVSKLELHKLGSQSHDMLVIGWLADYPDPDSFLRNSLLYSTLGQYGGWQDARYDELVNEAATMTNRARRIAMYREADKIWVADQVVACPLLYGLDTGAFAKPWVIRHGTTPLGIHILKQIVNKKGAL